MKPRNYKAPLNGFTLFVVVADVLSILVSIALALVIRAQFRGFMVTELTIVVVSPWVLLLRILGHFFFGHYSISPATIRPKDIADLLLRNIPVSLLLVVLRVATPGQTLHFPFSVIGMEYVFSSFGFVAIRLLFNRLATLRSSHAVGYRPRVLLWAEPVELLDSGMLELLKEREDIVLRGILTPNAIRWDTEMQGIRIEGDERALPELLSSDDTISTVCILKPEVFSRTALSRLWQTALRLRLTVQLVDSAGMFIPISRRDLLSDQGLQG